MKTLFIIDVILFVIMISLIATLFILNNKRKNKIKEGINQILIDINKNQDQNKNENKE